MLTVENKTYTKFEQVLFPSFFYVLCVSNAVARRCLFAQYIINISIWMAWKNVYRSFTLEKIIWHCLRGHEAIYSIILCDYWSGWYTHTYANSISWVEIWKSWWRINLSEKHIFLTYRLGYIYVVKC